VAGKGAAVVVPVWRPFLDADESMALQQCCAVLGGHPIILVAPQSLDLDNYPAPAMRVARVLRLPDVHFTDARAFGALLLSREFYRTFLAYRYLLIHQLDAFVFEDRLQYWCERGYSYVGAPWLQDWPLRMYRRTLRAGNPATRFIQRIMSEARPQSYRVGNGGFSLRRVHSFYRTARLARAVIAGWHRNEDTFWGIWAANFVPGFRVPPLEEALRFAVETEPRAAMQHLDGGTPFGCHAWARRGRELWWPYIERSLAF
jgi:hypothetical protein